MPASNLAIAPPPGRLAELSLQGLRQAQQLRGRSIDEIAARLYRWNRLPTSALRRIESEPLRLRTLAARAATENWINVQPGQALSPWCVWRPRGEPIKAAGRCWKVYVSPLPARLGEAVSAALAAATGLPVVSLKYGFDATSMLRPDKLVVHVATFEAAQVLGDRLLRLLDGCPVQGVPFTADFGANGLISYGCDPPAGSDAARIGPSWRAWVTRLLAVALASQSDPGEEPCQCALREISRAGVNPVNWAPKPELWAMAEPV
jgi:hypothetical protein